MDIVYLLVPLSVVLVFLIVGALAWSIQRNQFEDLERQGERILDDDVQDSVQDKTLASTPMVLHDNRVSTALDLDQAARPLHCNNADVSSERGSETGRSG